MSGRSGVALVSALLAIVLGATLVAAVGLAAREDQVASGTARDLQRAFTAAERAAWFAVAALDSGDVSSPLAAVRNVPIQGPDGDTITASITRIGARLFVAVGECGVRASGGRSYRRRSVVFVRATVDTAGVVSFAPLPRRAWAELP